MRRSELIADMRNALRALSGDASSSEPVRFERGDIECLAELAVTIRGVSPTVALSAAERACSTLYRAGF